MYISGNLRSASVAIRFFDELAREITKIRPSVISQRSDAFLINSDVRLLQVPVGSRRVLVVLQLHGITFPAYGQNLVLSLFK
jgi:hypothetical protein